MSMGDRQEAFAYLESLAEQQGYVTFDNIYLAAERWCLPLKDVDWLASYISTIGILIYDKAPTTNKQDIIDEEFEDYAQSDYDELYNKVVELEPNLQPFVDDIRHIRPAQYKEIPRLVLQAQDGNRHARDRLIKIHLRAALRIAYQRSVLFDEDITDCLSNACVGVVIAVDRYNPKNNGPLGSYISMWILQNMIREQTPKCKELYFPFHKREPYFLVYPVLKAYGCTECNRILRCRKARSIVEEELGYDYEYDDISNVLLQSCSFYSLEELSEKGIDIDDFFYEYDYYDDNCDSLAIKNEREKIINESLQKLSEREQYVIRCRFGFERNEPLTLAETAKALGLTKERIRQIEARALNRLMLSDGFRKIREDDYKFRRAVEIKDSVSNKQNNIIGITPLAQAFPPNRFNNFLLYCYRRNILYVENLSTSIISSYLAIEVNRSEIKKEMNDILSKYKMRYIVPL